MNLVGTKAPDFKAATVMPDNKIDENFTLHGFRGRDMAVLFFYPLDFTFVCPSEIIAFNNRITDFASRGVKIIAVSVDSHFTHLAWRNTDTHKGGIGHIKFPLVSDLTKNISRDYNVLLNEAISLRGTFLIDKEGMIRHQLINDLPLGRNVDETLRTIDALIFHEKHGEVCPAGWQKGKSGMKATSEGVADYLTSYASEL